MKQSRRAQWIRRHQQRMQKPASLNLVSLMDIFTILVFFLMVNSSNVEVLQQNPNIRLPDSLAEKDPGEHLVISVSATDIIVQGRKVADVNKVLEQDKLIIDSLKAELDYQAARSPLTEQTRATGRVVTVMGDRNLPYRLLKRIISTCVEASYSNVSLAVQKTSSAVEA